MSEIRKIAEMLQELDRLEGENADLRQQLAAAQAREREGLLVTLQRKVGNLYAERGYDASPQTLALGVMEEVGEMAMALLLTECNDFRPSAKKMSPTWADARDPAREIGDTITYLLALCNRLKITPKFKWITDDDASTSTALDAALAAARREGLSAAAELCAERGEILDIAADERFPAQTIARRQYAASALRDAADAIRALLLEE